jgi:hypothetical protein
MLGLHVTEQRLAGGSSSQLTADHGCDAALLA